MWLHSNKLESIPNYFLLYSDYSISGIESDFGKPNENNRRTHIGCYKAKTHEKKENKNCMSDYLQI